MTFNIDITTPDGPWSLRINQGSTLIIAGANGGGKTRLAVYLEENGGNLAHRISAHRALNLNPDVPKIKKGKALAGLMYGNHDHIGNRAGFRWNSKAATYLLNDYDFLIQAMFAEQSNASLRTHKSARAGTLDRAEATKFEKLEEIWKRLLPHRTLEITGDDIQVSASAGRNYSGSEMSEGERAIFYLIGQVLVAADNSLLIFDEPEIHVHRSIMSKLWGELEAIRPDCAFVLITHDLDFAAARIGTKLVIRDYAPEKGWVVENVPDDTGFSEEITTLRLGSRKPILFVEGAATSLDRVIYRACYPEWTVIHREACEQVIHAVVTMRANQNLTRVTCCGIVDADDHDATYLSGLGIGVLPVSEIENLLLVPDIGRAILEKEGYVGAELEQRLERLKQEVFAKAQEQGAIERVVARHCRRRIDRILKKVDLSISASVADIAAEYARQTAALDVAAIGAEAEARIRQAIADDNLPAFLRFYDDKAFLAIAAKHLKSTNLREFTAWLSRVLRNDSIPALTSAIRGHIPPVMAR